MAGEGAGEGLPPSWSVHESRSNPGHRYYFNRHTGARTWSRMEVLVLELKLVCLVRNGDLKFAK